MTPRVLGLDLSLSATGLAVIHDGTASTRRIKVASTGHERMDAILAVITGCVAVAVGSQ